jgi:hypothetical protein
MVTGMSVLTPPICSRKSMWKVGAAELAVGDALQAHVFLELHDLGDGLVFHRAQLLGRDVALGFLFAGFQQVLGAQKAADMVVAGG